MVELNKDIRFKRLSFMPQERKRLVHERLAEAKQSILDSKGTIRFDEEAQDM